MSGMYIQIRKTASLIMLTGNRVAVTLGVFSDASRFQVFTWND